MNLAHIHLILNHIPVVGIPVALAFLIYGLFKKSISTQRFALLVLIALAAIVVPVYLTGEPAEKVVEHLPGVAESFIESHEDAAMYSLVLTLLTGLAAFAALWLQNKSAKSQKANLLVIGFACATILSLLYTANLGGQVRHTELRDNFTSQVGGETESDKDND